MNKLKKIKGGMKYLLPILFVSAFLLSFNTQSLFAQNSTEYTLLAPLPLRSTDNIDTKINSFEYIPGLVRLAIAIAGVLAVLRIIIAGIQYMSTDAWSGKDEAKGAISEALWGLGLAMGAWLILYTVNPNLVEFNLSIEPVEFPLRGDVSLPIEEGSSPSVTDGEAKSVFEAENIVVKGGVRFDNLKVATLNEILRIKNECNCEVVLTAGSDGSHRSGACSHGTGYKVDMRSHSEGARLTDFIKSNYIQVKDSSGRPILRDNRDPMWKAPSGAIYALESSHWDMVAPGCSRY